jgi:outer membrane protein OmpA-like peptidoglycan-associated protein
LSEPGANEVERAPGAGTYYRKSRKLRRAAFAAYDNRNLERAKHLSIRGKLAYQTAEVIASQTKAKKRLEKANQQITEINPKLKRLVDERDTLQTEVRNLQQRVTQLENEQSRRARAARADANEETEESKTLKAQNAIDESQTHKQRALRVKANEFAQATYNRAANHLKSARTLLKAQTASPGEVADEAEKAATLFQKAQKEAKPKYEEHLAKMNPQERLQSLRKDLEFELGEGYVEGISRGVRAVVTDLFDKGASRIRQSQMGRLEELAKIAKEYDEFSLLVEGFTREGNVTQNLTISQVRAKNVRDLLKNRGVGSDRLSAKGRGQNRIRYPDQPAENDRVELVFRLPDN